LAVTITATGNRLTMPKRLKVPMPANPEEFRERIDLLAAGVEFFKLKQPAVNTFEKIDEADWTKHVRYILGDKVRGKRVLDSQGNVVKIPEWGAILNYEQSIRALAARLMNEGCSDNDYKPMMMHDAMRRAREDKELRTDEFIEQLSTQDKLESRRRFGVPSGSGSEIQPRKTPKGGGKDNGGKDKKVKDKNKKGKGKGKDKKLPAGKALLTVHNKEPICFAFNNKNEGCKKGAECKRVHVCQICLGPHPMFQCKA